MTSNQPAAARQIVVPGLVTTDLLNRIYAAIDYMTNLDGQDNGLVVEMSQAMLNDVIEGNGLRPMIDYVKRYCDVIDNEAEAEQIAEDI